MGKYYCNFLAKCSDYMSFSDEFNQCCSDWYRFSRDALTSDILFSKYTLLQLNIVLDHKNYIQWANTLLLITPGVVLHRIFDYAPILSFDKPQIWCYLRTGKPSMMRVPP